MAKVIVLIQNKPDTNTNCVRGVFSQKKKVWTALEELTDNKVGDYTLKDDVSGVQVDATYNRLCNMLTKAGRTHLLLEDKPVFLLVELVGNEIRDWDLDNEGKPKYNPVKKD